MADLNNDIEKYLKGELSPADRYRLEKLALDDPFLAEALEGAGEISAKDFHHDLNQIHSTLDKRIAEKGKGGSGWYWPMRIAASVLLLICSSYLVYFFITNDAANDLALNETKDTTPVEKEVQPLLSDSITPAQPIEEKTESTVSKNPALKKINPQQQPTPLAKTDRTENDKAVEEAEDQAIDAISQAEQVTGIAASEKPPTEASPLRSEESKITSKPEETNRAKKMAVPQGATTPQQGNLRNGFMADKADHRLIKGKVIDVEDGSPLPGVNVLVKGTSTGTMTDLDGNYQIRIEDTDHALVFSFIGLETKEEKIDGRSQLDVQLEQDVSELSEVVVTGYGYSENDIFTNTLSDYVQAEPEGGFKAYKIYLEDNLHYPIQAIENKVQGKVTVRFDISPTGVISDFQVTKGIGFGCDEEAIRLIRQGPKWSAPRRGDVSVKGRVKVRMKFTLPK